MKFKCYITPEDTLEVTDPDDSDETLVFCIDDVEVFLERDQAVKLIRALNSWLNGGGLE